MLAARSYQSLIFADFPLPIETRNITNAGRLNGKHS